MNVLVVDHSPPIRKLLQRVVEQAKSMVTETFEAGDGVEALALMRRQKIHLILSDVHMPNMDGLQLLREIRSSNEWKSIPMIMVTNDGSHKTVMEALNSGASGYLRKPFTPDQIKERLAHFA